MTRREHYFWVRANYPDRNAIACWQLSIQLLEWERIQLRCGGYDEAKARQFVAMQTAVVGMTNAVENAILAVGNRFAAEVAGAAEAHQELGRCLSEMSGR